MSDALAVRSDEGEARWWLGALAIIKATAADTGGNLTLLDVTDPPGVKARATSEPARTRTLPPGDHPMPDEERMMAAQAAAGCALVG